MIHQVKIRKCFFEEKIAGRKAWELRLDDRDYQIGDYLGINEIGDDGKETGRFVVEKIVDIVYPGQVPEGALGQGYVILSTVPCELDYYYLCGGSKDTCDDDEEEDEEDGSGTI